MKFEVSRKKYEKFTLFFAFVYAFFFVCSLVLEHVFQFYPCHLCVWERYLCLIVVVVLLLNFWWLNLCVALVGLGIGVFHKLVQGGEVASCTGVFSTKNLENFAHSIENSMPCVVKSSIVGVEFVWVFVLLNLALLCFLLFGKKLP